MKTKLTSLLLVLVMVVLAFASCGKTPDPQPGPGDNTGGNNTQGGGDVIGGGGTIGGDDPVVSNWWDDIDFGKKVVNIQLSNYVDNELPNGCDKYMKGPDSQQNGSGSGFEKVQNAVYLRNKACESAATGINVRLSYSYIDKAWNSVKREIVNNEASYGSNVKVDLYCDMEFDMMGAAIENGVFANLQDYLKSNNDGYFEFTKQNGYFVNYMRDLQLTDNRTALLASDYFMDVLRAMSILPFNLKLYGTTAATDDPEAEALYEMVSDGRWTWEELMKFQNVWNGSGQASQTDTLLMAVACGGMAATAFLYSTAYETYEYDQDGNIQFKTTCDEVYRIFDTVKNLMNTNGVICDKLQSELPGVDEANALFTAGNVLFAQPNLLGIIEEDAFQSMESISILPVPKLDEAHDYATLINSRARIGALSFGSTNQQALSAFVQYVTENSSDVKDEYFNKAMQGKYLVGSGAGEMLKLIYDCIGDNKSCILDNIIINTQWGLRDSAMSSLIKADHFTGNAASISSKYASSIDAKKDALATALESWRTCDSAER